MDYLRIYSNKVFIPKLIRTCEMAQLWPEAVFLHTNYEQHDQALQIMMEHSPSSFRNDLFSQCIVKITNKDLYYKAVIFYLEEEPMGLNELLKLLSTKIDLKKTCSGYEAYWPYCFDLDFP